jgi:hypothetical protein
VRAFDELQVLTLIEELGVSIPARLANLTPAQTSEARRAAERAVHALTTSGQQCCDTPDEDPPCGRPAGHKGQPHVAVMVWPSWEE